MGYMIFLLLTLQLEQISWQISRLISIKSRYRGRKIVTNNTLIMQKKLKAQNQNLVTTKNIAIAIISSISSNNSKKNKLNTSIVLFRSRNCNIFCWICYSSNIWWYFEWSFVVDYKSGTAEAEQEKDMAMK